MINSIDYSNYDNNDKFDFNPFKGIICIIIALVIYSTSWCQSNILHSSTGEQV